MSDWETIGPAAEAEWEDVAAPAQPAAPSAKGPVRRVVEGTARNLATVGDMALGIPSQLMSVMGDVNARLGAITRGASSREAARAGEEERNRILEKYSPHFLTQLVAAASGEEAPSQVEGGMQKLMNLLDEEGMQIEYRTGGLIKREDFGSLVNTAFAGAGALGAKVVAKKAAGTGRVPGERLEVIKAEKAVEHEWETITTERVLAERAAAQQAAIERLVPQTTGKARKVREKEVRGAFAEDPEYATYLQNFGEEVARLREAGRGEQARLVITEMPVRTRPAERTAVDEAPRTIEPIPGLPADQLHVVAPRALDSGLAKLSRGRAFDMTLEEKAAVRAAGSAWNRPGIALGKADPRLLAALGVASGGLLLAMQYPDTAEKGAALAGGLGGALLISRVKGKPHTLESLAALPESAPLGSILEQSAYTLKTLDRLPQNRFEFKKQTIREQLAREDVTAAEKDVLKAALDGVPGETVSARDLMKGVKLATQDFELKPQASADFAGYGLERVGRIDQDAGNGTRVDGAVPAETTIYRLPFPVSEANHFSDPNYFAHTRSFVEDGVRHVVEVQSDLAQKAGKVLSVEERTNLQKGLENVTRELHQFRKNKSIGIFVDSPEWGPAAIADLKGLSENAKQRFAESMVGTGRFVDETLRGTIDWIIENGSKQTEGARRYRREINSAFAAAQDGLAVLEAELRTKLTESKGSAEVQPMLKHWSRRLVREELAAAAQRGESSVRFATADTVAKVEGWPDVRTHDFSQIGEPPVGEHFLPEHQSIYKRYQGDIEKFLTKLGGKPLTDAQGHTWIEVPTSPPGAARPAGPPQMFGRASPDLLIKMGAVGGGALLGTLLDDKDARGAALGGLAGLVLATKSGRAGFRKTVEGADFALGLISTRMRNISEPLHHRAVEFERRVLGDTHARIAAADPFLVALEKVKGPQGDALRRAILTNDRAQVDALLPANLRPAWNAVRQMLNETGAELVRYGHLSNLRQDYFPRIVKDRDGLLEALGQTGEKTRLEEKLLRAERAAIRSGEPGLSDAAASAIINEHLKKGPGGSRPGFTKKRQIEEVTAQLEPFYAPPAEALHSYLQSATRAIERGRFFGENLVTKELDGRQVVDVESSIGRVVQQELDAGRITFKQADTLGQLLRTRFVESEKPVPGIVQDIKNAANVGLLGNFLSASTQVWDLATTVYAQGVLPTIAEVANKLTGRSRVSARDLGLADHISEEFVSTRPSAKAVNLAFKVSGFSKIDLFAKDVLLNAALRKARRNPEALRAKYGKAFGEEFPQLVAELQSGRVGDKTLSYLFHELSDVQPISKLEMPEGALQRPQGMIGGVMHPSLVYALKSFMLKQADIVRRDAYNEIKAGRVRKGAKALFRYATILGLAGAGNEELRNWILGRDSVFEAKDLPLNVLKTFGFSEYVMDKARQGKPVEALTGIMAPPYKMFDEILRSDESAIKYFPIFGRIFYERELGGAEKANAATEKRARKREREEENAQ